MVRVKVSDRSMGSQEAQLWDEAVFGRRQAEPEWAAHDEGKSGCQPYMRGTEQGLDVLLYPEEDMPDHVPNATDSKDEDTQQR